LGVRKEKNGSEKSCQLGFLTDCKSLNHPFLIRKSTTNGTERHIKNDRSLKKGTEK
jgi:hypothetical protein